MAENNPGKDKLDEINKELSKFEEKVLDIAAVLSEKIKNSIEEIRDEAAGVANILEKKVTQEIKNLAKGSDTVLKNVYKLRDGTASVNSIQKQIRDLDIKNYGIQRNLAALQEKGIISAEEREKQEKELTLAYQIQKDLLEGQVGEAKKLQSKIGLIGAGLKGISKIPFLKDVVDTNKALEAAAGASTRTGAAWAAFKSIVGDVAKSLADPVVRATLVVSLFQKIVQAGLKANTQVTNLSKSMAVSKDQAGAVRDRFVAMERNIIKSNDSLNHLLVTSENLVKAQLDLADAFGATQGFTDQQIRDQVYLTEQLGLSKEEAAGLQQLGMANSMTADEVVMSTIKQTAALSKQKGIQLDNKKVLGEVAKVSGQLRLQYQNNPNLIAKAVIQTQKLGMSLQQASDASKKLLDFEQSIEAELSAELLTGKDINLERARLLRLNGDVAGAMEAIMAEVGDINDFMNMNTIQQEAIASVAGMTADEFANSLVQQQNLNKLGAETKKQVEDKIKLLEKERRFDEANKLRNSIGNAKEAKAALESIDAQTTFNKAIEKLQSLIGNIVAGPMSGLLDKIAAWLSDSKNIEKLTKSIDSVATGLKNTIKFIVDNFDTIKTIAQIILGIIAVKWVAGLVSATSKALGLSRVMAATSAASGGGPGGIPGGRPGAGGGMMNSMLGGPGRYGAAMRANQMGKFGMSRAMGFGAAGGFGLAGGLVQMGGNYFADKFEEEGNTAAAQTTDVVSGAGQGALYGAALGSIVPGIGTAAGAIIGGAIGLISGGIEAASRNKEKENADKKKQEEEKLAQIRAEEQAKAEEKANAQLKELQKTNDLLVALRNKEGVVRYDSDSAGKNANINSYTIQ